MKNELTEIEQRTDQEAQASRAITDEQVITSLADEFDITFGESCDLILRVAENMRIAA